MQHSPNLTELVLGKEEDLNGHKTSPKKTKSRPSKYGMWTIDSYVPVPKPKSGSKAHYPWKELKVGESWFMPGKKKAAVQHRIKGCEDRKFVSERRIEDGIAGVRVWRVK